MSFWLCHLMASAPVLRHRGPAFLYYFFSVFPAFPFFCRWLLGFESKYWDKSPKRTWSDSVILRKRYFTNLWRSKTCGFRQINLVNFSSTALGEDFVHCQVSIFSCNRFLGIKMPILWVCLGRRYRTDDSIGATGKHCSSIWRWLLCAYVPDDSLKEDCIYACWQRGLTGRCFKGFYGLWAKFSP